MKTFYFLSGLPRSGATLLSSILNQNPDIYVAPQTDLVWQMILLKSNMLNSETYQLGQLHEGYKNVLTKLPHNFYEHRPEPIIIDKNRSWGLPSNLELAILLNSNIKIIALHRPILEILASFVRQCEQNTGNNYIDKNLVKEGYLNNYSINDARCKWLMDNELKYNIESLQQAYTQEHKSKFLLISYNDLINDTKTIVNKISLYLDLPEFKYNLENIENKEIYKDEVVYGLPNLHKVRNTINKNKYDIESYISNKIKKEYEGII